MQLLHLVLPANFVWICLVAYVCLTKIVETVIVTFIQMCHVTQDVNCACLANDTALYYNQRVNLSLTTH